MEAPAVIDSIVESAASDPVFVGLVVILLLVVLLGYLFVRWTLASMRDGYRDAYRSE